MTMAHHHGDAFQVGQVHLIVMPLPVCPCQLHLLCHRLLSRWLASAHARNHPCAMQGVCKHMRTCAHMHNVLCVLQGTRCWGRAAYCLRLTLPRVRPCLWTNWPHLLSECAVLQQLFSLLLPPPVFSIPPSLPPPLSLCVCCCLLRSE